MKPSILFVNQNFHPDQSASARYLTQLALSFVARGWNVTVLCAAQGYLNPDDRFAQRELWQGIQIRRVRCFRFRSRNSVLRILEALFLHVAFAANLLMMARCDIAVALTSPPFIVMPVALFSRAKRIVYWILDLNPDQVFAAGVIRENSGLGCLLKGLLRALLRYCDSIVVLDSFMQTRVRRYLPMARRDSVQTVPLWADSHLVSSNPDPHNHFRKAHGLEESIVVMYAGNMSLCHPLDTVIQAARALKDDPRIVFVFLGGGKRREEIIDSIERYQLENVRLLPYVAEEVLCDALSAADLHLVSLGDAYPGIVHPSKIYGILAIPRPFAFLGSADSFIVQEFVSRGMGMQIEHGDAGSLTSLIAQRKYYELNQKCHEHHAWFLQTYAEAAVLPWLIEVIIGERHVLPGEHEPTR